MGQPHKHAEVVSRYSQVNVSTLSGPALDWAVAKCENALDDCLLEGEDWLSYIEDNEIEYSRDWSQGGPIIEREKIGTTFNPEWEVPNWGAWRTDIDDRQEIMGETPLVAAMRCYVASKMGDTIEVPSELV